MRVLIGREEKLKEYRSVVWVARLKLMDQFLKTHGKFVKDFDFEPEWVVLYWNTRVEKEANQKSKPRYLGLMVVIQQTKGGPN